MGDERQLKSVAVHKSPTQCASVQVCVRVRLPCGAL